MSLKMADFGTDAFIDAFMAKAEKFINGVVEPIQKLDRSDRPEPEDPELDAAILEMAQNAAAIVWAGVLVLLDPPPGTPQTVVMAAMMMAKRQVDRDLGVPETAVPTSPMEQA